MVSLDKITLGAVAGAGTNLVVGGIGARLAMRAVVLLIGGQPAVTLEGVTGILLLAAMLGIVLGVAVAFAHNWAGHRWRQADWLLGGLLTLLVTALFLAIRDGEAALLPAWQGVLLFAPLALLSTLATGFVYERLRRRRAGKIERQAPAAWLGAYGIAFVLAFVGLMSLAGGPLRLPRAAWHMALMAGASADFAGAYVPMQMLGFVFAVGYLLLTWLLFWLADGNDLRAGAIGCLLLAAGFFHITGPIAGVLGRGLTASVLEGLLAAVGAAVLAVVYWRLFAGSPAHVRRAPLAISLVVVAAALAGLSALMAVQPQWSVLRQPLLVTLFSVTMYLLPWLALPLGLLCSMQRNHGGQANAAAYQAGALADAG